MPRREDIPSLTGLRGVAATIVLLYHTRVFTEPVWVGFPDVLLQRGYLAVDLFFILSGFIIAHVYGATFVDRVTAKDYWTFLRARFARIYPMHLVALVILLPLLGRAADFQPHDLLLSLALLNGVWMFHQGWNHPAWSVAAEFHTYVVFPFAAGLLLKQPKRRVFAIVAAAILFFAIAARGEDAVIYTPWVLIRAMPEFVIGIVVYREWRAGARLRYLQNGYALAAIVAAILLCCFVRGSDQAIVLILFPLLVLACAQERGASATILGKGPIAYLGRISYSTYILHWPALIWFAVCLGPMRGWAATFILMAIILAIAAAASHVIEYPARRYLRGWQPRAMRSPGLDRRTQDVV
ncbi:MAG TPA: acyltransferase [Stellaceae bacterium]|nr:acyltransferase [Stellaceae bacterium]